VEETLQKVSIDPWVGQFVIASTSDKKIHFFDLQTGETFTVLSGHSEPITGLCFSNDCRFVVSSGVDGCLFFWQLSKELVKTILQRRVDRFGVESIEFDQALVLESFLSKTTQQGISLH